MNIKFNFFIVCLILLLNITIVNAETAIEWYETGKTLAFDLGKYEEALVAFNKSLELNSTNADVWHNQGMVFGLLDRYEEADKSFNKAIEINPKFSMAYSTKGLFLSCWALISAHLVTMNLN
jgi:tetratricopeptide (TPR) repeat protein